MNAMKMDAKRSICSVKMIIIIVALVFTLIFSSWDMIRASKKDIFACGVIDMLGTALMMDKFKVLMVMFTAGIYTAGFCYDFKHHYIRMILARTDLISYSISKFIVNTVAVVFACIASFYLFLVVAVGFLGANLTQIKTVPCYYQIGYKFPVLYIGMMRLQFGMVCAMSCAVGMLFSVFQPNTLFAWNFGGTVFFSAIWLADPLGSIFDVSNLISMQPTLPAGQETLQGIMFFMGNVISSLCNSYLYISILSENEMEGAEWIIVDRYWL